MGIANSHTLGMIELSCADGARLASFWSTILGLPVDGGASRDYAQISPPEPFPKLLFVRREPSGRAQSVTLAITSSDLRTSTETAVAAGAVAYGLREQDGFRWSVLDDPEGNRFTFNSPPPA